jgi:hypothetical protein
MQLTNPIRYLFSQILEFVVTNNFAKPVKDWHIINEMAESYLLYR